ncbi:hypothetical protein SAMN04487839_12017 [Streptococcus gallolyticus]|uniref:Uncharacterized protein n=1 Tax=Streptococcus gallolyticus TaxID=315405 RepID=A0A1H7XYV5_9STRE|nr:hypothetical protein [Streptococcus gallolyticus]SEF25568.1 hypothetical protein SAMN02910295_0206 [Streptococcus gallolyticus]SEM38139.1 hypothetical protein SAMN04487839_12017 [Streptococcus gallolyticus]
MNLEALKERRDELVKDNNWVDDLIKEKEEELWELKVRTIAAQELARSAMQSCLRTMGIVDSFYGPDSQKKHQEEGEK